MKRRDFLRYSLPPVAAAMVGKIPVQAMGLESPILRSLIPTVDETDHVLVLVQLIGGNDGLNTVIPIDTYSTYQAARSNLAIPENKILSLNGVTKSGLHPSMTGIQSLFNDGKAAIIQGVGYPQPDFSHFRSTDIWMSGSDSDEYIYTGWIGRYLETQYPGFPLDYPNTSMPDPIGIQIGSVTSLTFQGPLVSMGMTISNPSRAYNLVGSLEDVVPNSPAGDELTFVRTISRQSQEYTHIVKDAALSITQQSTYPANNELADKLKIVAQLIAGGLKTRVYVVSMTGFDTHSSQVNQSDTTTGTHANLIGKVSDAIKAFMDDLKFLGINKRVLGMTFSEFGRRIKSNSSLGCDHGAAAPMILFGDYVNPGLFGTNPELPGNATIYDNIPMQYDYRSVYASVLERWFCVDETTLQTVLLKNYQSLPLIKGAPCSSTLPELENNGLIKNYPNPFVDSTKIIFKTDGGHTSVMIMDTMGRVIKTLVDQNYTVPGQYTIQFNGERLATGVYYARLQNGVKQEVRSMLKVR